MADAAQKFKPAGMTQATWDYLLKFTIHHEAVVVHMYHNYPKGSKFPDVSCGIGFLLQGQTKVSDPSTQTPTDATVNTWLSYFTKKDGTPATKDDFIKDWEECYKISRAGNVANKEIKEFADKMNLRMTDIEKIKSKMAEILVSKLNIAISGAALKGVDFYNLPATAQVGVASLAYGYSPSRMPNFCDAIKKKDFLRAASESKLSNMSSIKNEDHRLLFSDAAYVVEQRADDPAAFTHLPTKLSGWMPLYAQMGIQGQNSSQ